VTWNAAGKKITRRTGSDRGRGILPNGKSKRTDDPFVRVSHRLINAPAFKALSAKARTVLLLVMSRWHGNPADNGALSFSAREAEPRALGCVISTVVFRGGGDRRAVTRLHSRVLVETAPDYGLPIVPMETIIARAHVEAAVQQASVAHARYRHHLTGLADRGQRWRLGAELQARLAATGLIGAEGRP
jgi:hypothetical protein